MSTDRVRTSTRGEEGPAHVDTCGQGEEGKKADFFGRNKWMTPK